MRHFCTYFDRNYMLRGLTLYRSLRATGEPFVLWVLCLDDESHASLTELALENLRPVRLADFERGDDALLATRDERSRVEYYFTLTPSWPLWLFDRHPEIDLITYVDADLYFFSSPQPIFDELGTGSVLIVGHRFPERMKELEETTGIYNVGLVAFRNDERGRTALRWWRERCIEWCFDRVEPGRYADQKYLDDWPERFPGTVVLRHPGAGLAPWNWMNYDIRMEGGGGSVEGQPLVFYHFHHLRMLNPWLYDPCLGNYGYMPLGLKRRLYGRYVRELRRTRHWLRGTPAAAHLQRSMHRSLDYSWRTATQHLLRGHMVVAVGPLTV